MAGTRKIAAILVGNIVGFLPPDRSRRHRRRARACHAALGHAGPAAIARRSNHEHSTLAGLAWAVEPLHHTPRPHFCEYADTKPRKTPMWFALNDGDRCGLC